MGLLHSFVEPVNGLREILLHVFAFMVNFAQKILRVGVARKCESGKLVEMRPKFFNGELVAVFRLYALVFFNELAFVSYAFRRATDRRIVCCALFGVGENLVSVFEFCSLFTLSLSGLPA